MSRGAFTRAAPKLPECARQGKPTLVGATGTSPYLQAFYAAGAHSCRLARPTAQDSPAPSAGSPDVSTPSSLPSSSTGESRVALRRALVTLIMTILGLLVWQLAQEYRQLLDSQRQLHQAYATQLARHLSQSMSLKAQTVQVILQSREVASEGFDQRIGNLREVFPTLSSVAWFDSNGQLRADSAGPSRDQAFIRQLLRHNASHDYHYAFSPREGGTLYLLLRQPDDSHHVLRLQPQVLDDWLRDQERGEHQWLLEDRLSQRVIARADDAPRTGFSATPVTAAEQAHSLEAFALSGSDWQLRALFDAERAGNQLMPALAGKFLLFILQPAHTAGALWPAARTTPPATSEHRITPLAAPGCQRA